MAELKTVLNDWHRQHGARMVSFGGWDMPVQYRGIIEEHKAVRQHSGMFDISHMGRLYFKGNGIIPFLDKLCTNQIESMKPNQVRYSLICNSNGGILDDVLVYRLAGQWLVVVNASNREKIVQWIKNHQIDGDFQLVDETLHTAMIAIQGPQSLRICQDLFVDSIQDLAYYYSKPNKIIAAKIGLDASDENLEVLVSRTGYTGEDGIEIIANNSLAVPLANTLLQLGVVPCGLGARDTLRLEAAMPLYGHELHENVDPIQAGLEWAVKLNKRNFLGREGLIRTRDSHERIRIGLELEGKRAAREGALVYSQTQVVGQITSGSYSPTLDRSIAMAYVRADYGILKTALLVDIRGTFTPATVVALPFYKRPGSK